MASSFFSWRCIISNADISKSPWPHWVPTGTAPLRHSIPTGAPRKCWRWSATGVWACSTFETHLHSQRIQGCSRQVQDLFGGKGSLTTTNTHERLIKAIDFSVPGAAMISMSRESFLLMGEKCHATLLMTVAVKWKGRRCSLWPFSDHDMLMKILGWWRWTTRNDRDIEWQTITIFSDHHLQHQRWVASSSSWFAAL